jgi:hypothetical protein
LVTQGKLRDQQHYVRSLTVFAARDDGSASIEEK